MGWVWVSSNTDRLPCVASHELGTVGVGVGGGALEICASERCQLRALYYYYSWMALSPDCQGSLETAPTNGVDVVERSHTRDLLYA